MLSQRRQSVLGNQPTTVHHLNGGSFQQDCVVSHRGWQYAAFYQNDSSAKTRIVYLARRNHSTSRWETIHFDDYSQTEDDGHNTISLGICPSDGTIHLAWDCHSSPIRYRRSLTGLAHTPENAEWTSSSFGEVLATLPGVKNDLTETTYPRFLSMPEDLGGALLFEIRTGIAGLGQDHIFAYQGGDWVERGTYLQGVENSPYINGIDVDKHGTLYVSWCNRAYVPVKRGQSSVHAGPNGPENNHDLFAAYSPISDDGLPGLDWYDLDGNLVAQANTNPITPTTRGVKVFDIARDTGVLNQEAQCIAPDGLHVLNRETIDGVARWIHYHPSTRTKNIVSVDPQSKLPPRGKILYRSGRVIALFQDHKDLVILDLASQVVIGRVEGGGGSNCPEVLFDRYRNDVLSIVLVIDGKITVVDMGEV